MRAGGKIACVPGLVLGLILSLVPLVSVADEGALRQYAMFVNPQLAQHECGLYKRGTKQVSHAGRAEAATDDYSCEVSISKTDYEAMFRFCFMSGVNLHRSSQVDAHECFIQRRADDYLFRSQLAARPGSESQLICYFSCLTN